MNPRTRDIVIIVVLFLGLVGVGLNAFLSWSALAEQRRLVTEAQLANSNGRQLVALAKDIEEHVRPPKPAIFNLKSFMYSCHTSALEATCVLTNTNAERATANACIRGVVLRADSSATVESIMVCTGDVKFAETRVLQAPYTIDAVSKLCPGDYGGVSWKSCSFTVVDAAAGATK